MVHLGSAQVDQFGWSQKVLQQSERSNWAERKRLGYKEPRVPGWGILSLLWRKGKS